MNEAVSRVCVSVAGLLLLPASQLARAGNHSLAFASTLRKAQPKSFARVFFHNEDIKEGLSRYRNESLQGAPLISDRESAIFSPLHHVVKNSTPPSLRKPKAPRSKSSWSCRSPCTRPSLSFLLPSPQAPAYNFAGQPPCRPARHPASKS